MNAWPILGAVFVLSCSPYVSGTYSGALDDTITCSDGSTANITRIAKWTLQQDADAIRINTSVGPSPCGIVTAEMREFGRIELKPKTCSVTTDLTEVLKAGGIAQVDGQKLKVSYRVNASGKMGDGWVGVCDDAVSGTLEEQ